MADRSEGSVQALVKGGLHMSCVPFSRIVLAIPTLLIAVFQIANVVIPARLTARRLGGGSPSTHHEKPDENAFD